VRLFAAQVKSTLFPGNANVVALSILSDSKVSMNRSPFPAPMLGALPPLKSDVLMQKSSSKNSVLDANTPLAQPIK
jgi:hypothetical protein